MNDNLMESEFKLNIIIKYFNTIKITIKCELESFSHS